MSSKNNKGAYSSVVTENTRLRETFYRLTIRLNAKGAEAFSATVPGQFAELNLAEKSLPPAAEIPEDLADCGQRNIILRRPFSFSSVIPNKDETLISILYCVVGPASLRMTALKPGDILELIGPLGNGFTVEQSTRTALLVTGGMGAGPIIHLADYISSFHPEISIKIFAGARTREDLPFENLPETIPASEGRWLSEFGKQKVMVTTDDGSAGYKGFVTECVNTWIDEHPAEKGAVIYSCGPEPMLAAVAKSAAERHISSQVSMERMMACGISLCQGCAVECKKEGGETEYKMCCGDGPVFDGSSVI